MSKIVQTLPASDEKAASRQRVRRYLGWLFALLAIQTLTYCPATGGGDAIPMESDLTLISHAGAGLKAATYSNSREALEVAAARGLRLIEVDFETTRDGRVVAAHDWGQTYVELRPGILPAPLARYFRWGKPDHATFLATPMKGGLTPIDAIGLARWLDGHPDVKIVTDIKSNNVGTLARLIAHGLPREQLVPQIYSRDELAAVRRMGFNEIIYTLYRDTDVPIPDVIDFARKHRLAVTIHSARVSRADVEAFRDAGVPLYVHTINEPDRALRLQEWGAAGVYTDFLRPAS